MSLKGIEFLNALSLSLDTKCIGSSKKEGVPLHVLAFQNIAGFLVWSEPVTKRKVEHTYYFKCVWNKLHHESEFKSALNTFPVLLFEFCFEWWVSTIVRHTSDLKFTRSDS